MRQPAIWHSDALAACHGAALVSLITFLPVYLEVVRGFTPSTTGLLLVPLTIGIGIGSLTTGRLVNSTGLTTIFPVVGLALCTVNFVVLALWASTLGTAALAVLLLFTGLFMGTVMGVVQVSVQSAAGQLRLGEAAASVQFSRSIGRGLRHRAGGDLAVCRAGDQESGSGRCLCRHGRARQECRRQPDGRSARRHSSRYRRCFPRRRFC